MGAALEVPLVLQPSKRALNVQLAQSEQSANGSDVNGGGRTEKGSQAAGKIVKTGSGNVRRKRNERR